MAEAVNEQAGGGGGAQLSRPHAPTPGRGERAAQQSRPRPASLASGVAACAAGVTAARPRACRAGPAMAAPGESLRRRARLGLGPGARGFGGGRGDLAGRPARLRAGTLADQDRAP